MKSSSTPWTLKLMSGVNKAAINILSLFIPANSISRPLKLLKQMKNNTVACLCVFLFLQFNSSRSYGQSWLWAKSGVVQTNQSSFSNGVVADAAGNSYVVGSYYSPTIRFDSATLTNAGANGFDIFLVKYLPNGSVAWARTFGGTGNDEGYGIALDAQGHIYICGYFDSPSFTIGPATFSNNGGEDLFLAKLDPSGQVIWAQNAGGAGNDVCLAICTDAKGRPCIAGNFNSPLLSMGSVTLSNSTSQTQPIVAKYDTSGTFLWAKTATGSGGSNGNYAATICSDTASNIYAAGGFSFSTIQFGSQILNNSGITNCFLAKYDTSGTVSWVRGAGGINEDAISGVGADQAGNIYVSGSFNSPSISFGTYTLVTAGQDDAFIAKYDPNGTALWAKSSGGTGDEQANSVAVDAMGYAYISGSFSSQSFRIGTSNLVNNGNLNIFFAEYNPWGDVLWARCAGGSASDYGLASYTDLSGNAWMAGYFTSPSVLFDSHTVLYSGSTNMYVAKIAGITGIESLIKSSRDLLVYPNPSDGHFVFSSSEELTNSSFLAIYNSQGVLVRESLVSPGTSFEIDASLPAGLYLFKLESEKRELISTGKLIIK